MREPCGGTPAHCGDGAVNEASAQLQKGTSPMPRHLADAALAAVYAATTFVLLTEGMLAHAGCALAAALIYAASCVPPPSNDRGSR